MATDDANERRGPGRPRMREQADLRITVRLRHHCDQDLIDALEEVPRGCWSQFIRESIRIRLASEEETGS